MHVYFFKFLYDFSKKLSTGNCYTKVEAETKEIQEKIKEKLGNHKPIENDVIVLYNDENLPDEVINNYSNFNKFLYIFLLKILPKILI